MLTSSKTKILVGLGVLLSFLDRESQLSFPEPFQENNFLKMHEKKLALT